MIRLFVRHPVASFAHWKQAYDAFDDERQGMGVVDHAVYQATGDPNDVTVFHDFQDLETAQEFVGSARLKEVMEEAGVAGEPQIWFAARA